MRKLNNLRLEKRDLDLISFERESLHFDFYLAGLYFGIGFARAKRLSRFFGCPNGGTIAGFNYSAIMDFEIFLRRNIRMERRLIARIYLYILKCGFMKTFKGFRHRYGLPVNGQSSRNNANNCSKTDSALERLYDRKYRLYRDKYKLLNRLDSILNDRFFED